ncbi:MAG: aminoacyl-tRNA hydrolase [Pseudomonadota bacterium]
MSSCPIQLIAGLANPGKDYAKSRHNAGAWLVEALAENASLFLKAETKFQGLVAKLIINQEYNIPGESHIVLRLLIPTTYMNLSGHSLRAITQFYHISPEAILVVHDDLDLPPGIARFKQGGGEGGHNGLKDIVAQLGSKNFWRLRIGIGHPGHRDKVHDYVLSPPSVADRKKIDDVIVYTLSLLVPFVTGDEQRAIQTLHHFTSEK